MSTQEMLTPEIPTPGMLTDEVADEAPSPLEEPALEEPQQISITQYARNRGLDHDQLYLWIIRGHLPSAQKLGRDWTILTAEADAYRWKRNPSSLPL